MTEIAVRTLPRYVEVETSRRCNRTCAWCPNAEHDARQVQQLMDWALFRRVVDELGTLDYGWLAFHNYNEPLLNERILDEIGYVRTTVPAARPAIYSNGDVLDSALFHRLITAGVGYLRVTRYPRHADTPPSYGAITAWLRRVGLTDAYAWKYTPVRQGLAAVLDTGAWRAEVISPGIASADNTALPLSIVHVLRPGRHVPQPRG